MHLIKFINVDINSMITPLQLRKLLSSLTKEYIDDFLSLTAARDSFSRDEYNTFKEKINLEIKNVSALSIKDLDITGNDLIKNGIKAGPKLGKILKTLLESVLEEPLNNKKDILLKLADTL